MNKIGGGKMSSFKLQYKGTADSAILNPAVEEIKNALGGRFRAITSIHFEAQNKSDDRVVEAILGKHRVEYRKW